VKKVTTTINAIDKKQGMSPQEIAAAMRGVKYGVSATAVISVTGRIKSITLTEEKV
jgi:hypothetical protein